MTSVGRRESLEKERECVEGWCRGHEVMGVSVQVSPFLQVQVQSGTICCGSCRVIYSEALLGAWIVIIPFVFGGKQTTSTAQLSVCVVCVLIKTNSIPINNHMQ